MATSGAADQGISAREAEVLTALGEHLTNAEIAGRFFISVRTVESHVSSLLRKLGANDRRGLAALARELAAQPPAGADVPAARQAAALPSPLTSFVGRSSERAELVAAVQAHRLVTAVGPGGVGKTRLALVAAADAAGQFADGVWYVDLVPVADGMVPVAVASALGLGEQPGRSAVQTVLGWAAGRQALVVLDNCEHVLDGVVALVERLLAEAAGLTVLATSRSRLLLPFEWVFPVPGLALSDDGAEGDAVTLFTQRARAAGVGAVQDDPDRVRRICRALEGVPLAIELAAARLPAVGLDGLEAGLGDRLQLLTGARRVDDRHSSLRSTLDWSHDLLDEAGRAALRRVAVFAGPFRADAAGAVIGWPPVAPRDVSARLAALADHSLLLPAPAGDGTRYSALETIRQYGAERLTEAGELDECRTRHLRWCVERAGELLAAGEPGGPALRTGFDLLADEMRAALGWAAERPDRRDDAHALAVVFGALCHRRGMPAEAQRRLEQAAELAADDGEAAVALRRAAGSARARLAGDDALRLHRAAALAARGAGDSAFAARELAHAAELVHRSAGILADVPAAETAEGWLSDARRLAGDDIGALARIAVVEAFAGSDGDPRTASLTDRALELAGQTADPYVQSAALDQLTGLQLARGEARAALASAVRRTELLVAYPPDSEQGFELPDAYGMAAESAIAAGDLRLARGAAERLRDLPSQREVGHVGTARLVVVMILAGDWDEAVTLGSLFRESWERAGSPRIPSLRRVAAAVGSVHGARGDIVEREEWRAVESALASARPRPHDQRSVESFFEALMSLHLGRPGDAVEVLARPPEEFESWFELIWRPWYAALRAESGVLAGLPDAADRILRARPFTTDNVVAAALLDRAAALAAGDRDGLLVAADALDAAACRYQWARSLLLAGGDDHRRGEAALTAMGAPVA